jgi:hypothetical protein
VRSGVEEADEGRGGLLADRKPFGGGGFGRNVGLDFLTRAAGDEAWRAVGSMRREGFDTPFGAE